MIDMAADTMETVEVKVGEKKLNSSVILHQGHAMSIDMDYYYTAIRKTFFSYVAHIIYRFLRSTCHDSHDDKDVRVTLMSKKKISREN